MRSVPRYLSLIATVAFVALTALFAISTPATALALDCPPDVETCHNTPRALPGLGCVGSECFSTHETCCIS